MKIILFGATGMIGQGALLECLDDPSVERVLAVVRRPTGRRHDKLVERVHDDFLDWSPAEAALAGHDACLYCLGTSAAGMGEADYRRVTYDLALAAGRAVLRQSPQARLCFVSGAGTRRDSRQMWARVKAETEDALLALPWRSAHCFRPGYIQPVRGVRSGTPAYQAIYTSMGWLYPLWRTLFPNLVTTSAVLGRALLRVGRDGHALQILESRDINAVGA